MLIKDKTTTGTYRKLVISLTNQQTASISVLVEEEKAKRHIKHLHISDSTQRPSNRHKLSAVMNYKPIFLVTFPHAKIVFITQK